MDTQHPEEQFEQMARHGALVNAARMRFDAEEEHMHATFQSREEEEFRISQAVYFAGNAETLTRTDMFSYLTHELAYEVASHEFMDTNRIIDNGEPVGTGRYTDMLQSAKDSVPTVQLLRYLKEKLINTKKLLHFGREQRNRIDEDAIRKQLFGLSSKPLSAFGNAVETLLHDNANDSAWQPYLIMGLEKYYTMMKAELPDADIHTTEEIEKIQSDRQLLHDCKAGTYTAVALSSDILDLDYDIETYFGELRETSDPDNIDDVDRMINSFTVLHEHKIVYRTVRTWITTDQTIVAEGRYAPEGPGQRSQGDFVVFVVPNPGIH